MLIFIPTINRVDFQYTLSSLPDSWLPNTWLVAPPDEKGKHVYENILYHPEEVKGIGPVRQWIMDNSWDPKVMYMDDDLTFQHRKYQVSPLDFNDKITEGHPCQLEGADHASVEKMMDVLCSWMYDDGIPVVSTSLFEYNRFYAVSYYDNYRIDRCYAVDRDKLNKIGFRWDRMKLMESFDMALSMLRAGYRSRSTFHWTQLNTRMSNASGGCSTYRTTEMQSEAAVQLQQIHGKYITIVDKKAPSWGKDMAERKDVRIRWAQSFKDVGYEL